MVVIIWKGWYGRFWEGGRWRVGGRWGGMMTIWFLLPWYKHFQSSTFVISCHIRIKTWRRRRHRQWLTRRSTSLGDCPLSSFHKRLCNLMKQNCRSIFTLHFHNDTMVAFICNLEELDGEFQLVVYLEYCPCLYNVGWFIVRKYVRCVRGEKERCDEDVEKQVFCSKILLVTNTHIPCHHCIHQRHLLPWHTRQLWMQRLEDLHW